MTGTLRTKTAKPKRFTWSAPVLLLSLVGAACTAEIGTGDGSSGDGGGPGGTGGINPPAAGTEPGTKVMHRLNNIEYDNTVATLTGTTLRPATTVGFQNTSTEGFDNNARTLGITSGNEFNKYLTAATQIADDVFANPDLMGGIVTCDQAAPGDTACARDIITAFGLRAFRRPLVDAEIATYLGVYERAQGLGEDHTAAMKQVVRAFLSSADFLFRVETNANPDAPGSETLDGYELASRLSYFLWSNMPDDELLNLASNGELVKEEVLRGQVDRMLADPRSSALVLNFGGQWLGMRELGTHTVLPDSFPQFDDDLKVAMMEEGYRYFAEFLFGDIPWNEFLTRDMNFVNPRLAEHYGLASPGEGTQMVVETTDARSGFLGLAAFLTNSSFAYRTAPTLRAKWILEYLFCDPPPPPPPGADTDLEGDEGADAQDAAAMIENVRARLELHRTDPACAACHAALDPIGMALEEFDAIGTYRTQYTNGDAIDASGVMPDGTSFVGQADMATKLSSDPRLMSCVTEKLFTYGLGRTPTNEDKPYLEQIETNWEGSGNATLRNLITELVMNDTFRTRQGQPAQTP